MFEYKEGIEINIINENEFCDFFYQENNKIKVKYFINLLKKDVIYNYYDLLGENNIYLLKDENIYYVFSFDFQYSLYKK